MRSARSPRGWPAAGARRLRAPAVPLRTSLSVACPYRAKPIHRWRRSLVELRRVQLCNEVIGVTAIEGLRKLHRTPIWKEAASLHEQPGIALLGAQELRLLGGEEHRAQALQRP